jgi:hypothetical protein
MKFPELGTKYQSNAATMMLIFAWPDQWALGLYDVIQMIK